MFHGHVEPLVLITQLGWGDRGKVFLPSKQGTHFFKMGMKPQPLQASLARISGRKCCRWPPGPPHLVVNLESIERRLMWA